MLGSDRANGAANNSASRAAAIARLNDKLRATSIQSVGDFQPEAWSLKGAHIIEPATQGDYDGLCGLYSILNAVCLVAAPQNELSHDEVRLLFQSGVAYLARQGSLTKAVHTGIAQQACLKLARHVARAAQKKLCLHIMLEQPFPNAQLPVDEAMRMIEGLITSGKAPVVFMRGKYRHYSVISGFTKLSLRLFDSFDNHWVRRKSCGFGEGSARHRLHLPSLIAVSLV